MQIPAETNNSRRFFPFGLTLVDRVIWFLLLVGGDKYPVKLVEAIRNTMVIKNEKHFPSYVNKKGSQYTCFTKKI